MYISDIINFLKNNLSQTDITLHKGASENLISEVGHLFNVQLPDDVKDFYRFTNGFESAEDIFNIIPLEEVIDRAEDSIPNLYIAEYMIYSDMWELEIDLFNYNDYKIINIGEERIVLTKSFAEFIKRFLTGGVFEKGGLYDWHEEVKLNPLK